MKGLNKNYKKYFYFLFMLLFFTSVFTLSGNSKEEAAAASTTPQISYSVTGDKTVGSTITIAVNITNGGEIYGGSLDLIFDSNIIEVTSAKMGTLFEKDLKAPLINDTKTPGKTSVVITLSGANKSLSKTSGSLVVITAKVKKEGTINLKTTNDLSKLDLNGYTSCIKLSTKNAEKLNYTYTNTSFNCIIPKPLTIGKYEENNINLTYSSNWKTLSSNNYSGGSLKLTNTANSTLKFAFTGTCFELYGTKAITRGFFKVNIDGSDVATIDAYNKSTLYTQLLYKSSLLSSGTHNVIITVLNSKNTAATSIGLDIDKIIINNYSALALGTYEENNINLTYSSNWKTLYSNNYSGGSLKLTNTANSTLKFAFTGTCFEFYGTKAITRGFFKVNIDGSDVATIDAYNKSTLYTQLLYKSSLLSSGTHNVIITVLNSKNTAATSIGLDIDKIIIK